MTYLDANVIIRLLEGDAQTRAALASRLQGSAGDFITSELSLLEFRCRPLKLADTALLKLYDEFFAAPEMHLAPIDRAVVDKATELRATTRLRTPDPTPFGNCHPAKCRHLLHRRPEFQGHFPDAY